jgi:hypothetical protein
MPKANLVFLLLDVLLFLGTGAGFLWQALRRALSGRRG